MTDAEKIKLLARVLRASDTIAILMTHNESRLAELADSIKVALAQWDGLFEPGPTDMLATIAAGERMAGVLCRVQVLADAIKREQGKRESHEQV